MDDVLSLYRARLRACNVDLHAQGETAGRKRGRPIDFLGELIAGSASGARGSGVRCTFALSPSDGEPPLAALTLHVHSAIGVAELLLCAVRQQRANRGLGRAIVECALHALRARGGVRSVVCMASASSVGFWAKLGFEAEPDLPAAVWSALLDPFDDSVVLTLHADVVDSCNTRAPAQADRRPRPLSF